jgi:hypothetical protein
VPNSFIFSESIIRASNYGKLDPGRQIIVAVILMISNFRPFNIKIKTAISFSLNNK